LPHTSLQSGQRFHDPYHFEADADDLAHRAHAARWDLPRQRLESVLPVELLFREKAAVRETGPKFLKPHYASDFRLELFPNFRQQGGERGIVCSLFNRRTQRPDVAKFGKVGFKRQHVKE